MRTASLRIGLAAVWAGTALLGIGCGSRPEEEEVELRTVAVEMTAAKRADIRDLLPIDGRFEIPEGMYARLAPMQTGRLLKVLVKEGDPVRAGQLLAVVDTRVQAAESEGASNMAKAAQAQAAESETEFHAADADQKAAVEAAKAALAAAVAERDAAVLEAEDQLSVLLAGARRQEVEQAKEGVRQAIVTRDRTKNEWDRARELVEKGFISKQLADQAQAAYETAESTLAQARSQLDLVEAGARPEDIQAAKNRLANARSVGDKKVAEARAGLNLARQGALGVSAKKQAAAATQLAARQAGRSAAAASLTANQGEIRAPFDGVVARRLMNEGDLPDNTMPVLEIASNRSVFDFVGQVSPREAGQIQAGMAVTGDAGLRGTVASVSRARDAAGQVSVRIHLIGGQGQVRNGEFATLNVVARTLRDVVVVPVEAVVEREDEKVVFAVRDGIARLAVVQTGPAEGGRIAILQGLQGNENVVLVGQHEISDGTKVEAKGPASGETQE